MARAVHGLHRHVGPRVRLAFRLCRAVARLDQEHVLAVVLPVPRGLPERLVVNQRRLDFVVARREQHVAHVRRQQVVDERALAQPQGRAGRVRMEREEAEVLADPAMVPLLRFLDLGQVLLQLLVLEERRAVHALHGLIARIALPVRVRRGEQLERLQPAGRRHVRAHAEVHERVAILDGVAGDFGLARGLFLDQLHLEGLATLAEEADRFLARPHLPLVRQVLARQRAHLRFDLLEVLGHERAAHHEVVEEALVGRRSDAAAGAWKQLGDRGRQQVSGRVPVQRQGIRPVRRHDLAATRRRSSGKVRSTICPFTSAASAFFITPCGSAPEANSRTGVPAGTLRWEPSGRVTVTWDIWVQVVHLR